LVLALTVLLTLLDSRITDHLQLSFHAIFSRNLSEHLFVVFSYCVFLLIYLLTSCCASLSFQPWPCAIYRLLECVCCALLSVSSLQQNISSCLW